MITIKSYRDAKNILDEVSNKVYEHVVSKLKEAENNSIDVNIDSNFLSCVVYTRIYFEDFEYDGERYRIWIDDEDGEYKEFNELPIEDQIEFLDI